jgi:hypothetical protein
MCPMTLNLAFLLRWAPVLPRILWLRTLPLDWGRLWRCHVLRGSGSRLYAEVGSGAAMYPMSSNLVSRLRWTLVLPRVWWLQTLPPSWGELRRSHVSYGSGSRLLTVVDSDGTMCPAAPCEPGASNIKKRLANLPVQLGTHVPNAHVHFFKASDIRAIMGL